MVKVKGKGTKKKTKKEERRRGRSEERGLMSSASLMRYYDVEESAVKVSPKAILLAGILLGAVVLGLEIYFGVWPS